MARALAERCCISKVFLISNRSIRRKLGYYCRKVAHILGRESGRSEETSSVPESGCESKSNHQYYRDGVQNFGTKWNDTFTFHSCLFCLYTSPRSEFRRVDECDQSTLLQFQSIKEEYYSKFRLSGVQLLECQVNTDDSLPGSFLSIIFLFLLNFKSRIA